MPGNIDIALVIAQIVVLFLGIGLHEYAHCKLADLAGDPTPRLYGRVTLNLTKHFEPAGTILMILSSVLGLGIGWGRPAVSDSRKMRNPRWDFFISVAAGPVSNLVQAAVYALLFRMAWKFGVYQSFPHNLSGDFFVYLLPLGVWLNLRLALFNLIPFGPLDGHWLVGLLMPERERIQWYRVNRQIGMPGLFIGVMALQCMHIPLLVGPTDAIFHFVTGVPFDSIFG